MSWKFRVPPLFLERVMLWITYFLALLHFFIVLHTSSCLVFIIKISLSIEKFLKIFLCTQLFIPSILDFPVYHCFPEKSFLHFLTHLLPTNLNSFLPSFLIYFEPSILNCKLWSDSPHLSISSLWILVYSFCQASLFAISLLTMTLLLLKFPLFPPHSLLKVERCSKPFGISVDPNLNSRHPCFLSTHSRLTFILFFFSFFIRKSLSDSTVPSVYSLYPSLGPIAGGTACLLTGANFETNSTFCNFISSDNNSHLIRGMDATSTSVICESPPSASKSVFVEVITQQGRSSSKSKLIFLYSGTLYFLMFIMDPVTRDAYFPAIEIVASIQPSTHAPDATNASCTSHDTCTNSRKSPKKLFVSVCKLPPPPASCAGKKTKKQTFAGLVVLLWRCLIQKLLVSACAAGLGRHSAQAEK